MATVIMQFSIPMFWTDNTKGPDDMRMSGEENKKAFRQELEQGADILNSWVCSAGPNCILYIVTKRVTVE